MTCIHADVNMATVRDSVNISVADGKATVKGWDQDIRTMGGLSFLILRDSDGPV